MELTNINFWTLLIFVTSLLVVCGVVIYAVKKENLISNRFSNIHNDKLNYIKYLFLILAFIVLLPSILGMKTRGEENDYSEEGIDIVFVLDVSKSMNVEDIRSRNTSYNRLEFAKESIGNYVISNPNNRYSLIIFSGDASSVVPLTTDNDFFLNSLQNVDYRNLIVQGTNFERALSLAKNRFIREDSKGKAIIFMSDGGDREDFLSRETISKYKDDDILYFIAGVGTNEGGKIITGTDFMGRPIYQTYNGEYVNSSLNEDNLRELSEGLNGIYLTLSSYSHMNSFNIQMDRLEKNAYQNSASVSYIDSSRKLGFISFMMFILYLLTGLFGNRLITKGRLGTEK